MFSNNIPKPLTVDGGPGSGPNPHGSSNQNGSANQNEEQNKEAFRKARNHQLERLKNGLGGPSRITGR